MIRRIRGELVGHTADTVEVLAPDGLGYDVNVPMGLVDRLPGLGEPVELHTVLVVKDDALELYGFESAHDRELFRRLRGASGVGPRLALAILGALPSDRVVSAIQGKDHATLQTVSGVGKKTAERIAIELADKLDDMRPAIGSTIPVRGPSQAAIQALRALGYGPTESASAVKRAVDALDGREVGTENLVKNALQFV
ncbi:MAG: Holliday junction branch migration protein RuvA [Gemmatimonadetes bacterium]|nr:Holliday junction branch migration protein RuvA [Gemmatimonadota bacterium]